MSMEAVDAEGGALQVIEWHQLDKMRFFPLALSCSMTVRALLYPLTVVKTRLQIQTRDTVYKGTWDALRKIRASEGIAGLYKGYWINTFQIFSSVAYVSTYETVRHSLLRDFGIVDHSIRGLIGGACASGVGQTIIVPFDVVSQHMMILGNAGRADAAHVYDPLRLLPRLQAAPSEGERSWFRRRSRLSRLVVGEIYRQDGLRGFYRGYLASLVCYCPNSAGFWGFYHFYAERMNRLSPDGVPQLAVQCAAAPLAGLSTTALTNPLDLLRARLQVQRASLLGTLGRLWAEEGSGIFTKGLSTRMTASLISSLFIILGYESLKRVSVKEEYKSDIRW